VFLIETAPHTHAERNPAIEQYNALLHDLARRHPRVRCVEIYAALAGRLADYSFDATHLNEAAHDLIAGRLLAAADVP